MSTVPRWKRLFFGGDPRENERRYRANAELVNLTHMTDPWTVEALESAVRYWLDDHTQRET